MAISDKTRKILWGRSGNRCAVCRRELVIEATSLDDESIVGDECHIVSAKGQGPRHNPDFPKERLDDAENLVLLCRVHHKMIDDQSETYTVKLLSDLKQNHEKWVSETLSDLMQQPQVRVVRDKNNIPEKLIRMRRGRDIISILDGACAYNFENDELLNDEETDLIASFLQEAQDWGDMSQDMEAAERLRASVRMSDLLKSLEQAGFWVFAAREIRRIIGGVSSPSPFPVAIIEIVRETNPDIMSENPQ